MSGDENWSASSIAKLIAAGIAILGAGIAACSRSTCEYAHNQCDVGQTCAFVEPGKAQCVPFAEAALNLPPPFKAGLEFWCSQGGRSPQGRTHSFQGDLFALDLASPSPAESLDVVSPVTGDAYVFDECEERDSRPSAKNNTRCGLGYGNHVKIWDGTNIYLFGHLAHVSVKPGQINRDQVIGTMGCSGAAGHRHVHLTVTRPRPGDDVAKILATPGWKGQMPVRFRLSARALLAGAPIVDWSDTLPCAEERDRAVALQR